MDTQQWTTFNCRSPTGVLSTNAFCQISLKILNANDSRFQN